MVVQNDKFYLCQDWVLWRSGLRHLKVLYPWIPCSLKIIILDRLEGLVLQVAIFHLAPCAQSRERFRARFWRLRYRWSRGLWANSEAKLLRSRILRYVLALRTKQAFENRSSYYEAATAPILEHGRLYASHPFLILSSRTRSAICIQSNSSAVRMRKCWGWQIFQSELLGGVLELTSKGAEVYQHPPISDQWQSPRPSSDLQVTAPRARRLESHNVSHHRCLPPGARWYITKNHSRLWSGVFSLPTSQSN